MTDFEKAVLIFLAHQSEMLTVIAAGCDGDERWIKERSAKRFGQLHKLPEVNALMREATDNTSPEQK